MGRCVLWDSRGPRGPESPWGAFPRPYQGAESLSCEATSRETPTPSYCAEGLGQRREMARLGFALQSRLPHHLAVRWGDTGPGLPRTVL